MSMLSQTSTAVSADELLLPSPVNLQPRLFSGGPFLLKLLSLEKSIIHNSSEVFNYPAGSYLQFYYILDLFQLN